MKQFFTISLFMLLWSCSEAPVHNFENEALKVTWQEESMFVTNTFNYKTADLNGLESTGSLDFLLKYLKPVNTSSDSNTYKPLKGSNYKFRFEFKEENTSQVSEILAFLVEKEFIAITNSKD